MCEVNPEFKPFIIKERNKETLYLRLHKALYGYMQSAFLWYQTFKGKLQDMGLRLNKYDPCVANKIIDGKQCSITWYVDDLKISHADDNVISKVIETLEEDF